LEGVGTALDLEEGAGVFFGHSNQEEPENMANDHNGSRVAISFETSTS